MFTTETLFPPETVPTHHWSPWDLGQGIEELRRRHEDDPRVLHRTLSALVDDLSDLHTELYPEDADGRPSALERHALPPRRSLQLNSAPVTPALNIGGWFDLFIDGTLESFVDQRARGVPSKLLVGPWTHVNQSPHVGDVSFGVAADMYRLGLATDIWELQRDWFRSHLPEAGDRREPDDRSVFLDAPVMLFIMGDNVWRAEHEWPLARATSMTLHVAAGGSLTAAAPSVGEEHFIHDPSRPVPTLGGATLMDAYAAGPLRQNRIEERPDVLTYTTEVLDEDVEVTGHPSVVLDARSDASSADWIVRLCDVDGQGNSVLVTDGIVRAPGAPAQHEIELLPTAWVFKAGHRIRLQVSSSSFPRWLPNRGGSDGSDAGGPGADGPEPAAHARFIHRVAFGASRVTLPVIPRPAREP
ncbi:CocE/NonD family hydrolase [Agromyces aerolatus]|uniref:CocE/NonD family hydrolase n=1 Tax=Agromyces sp. LY-1074 TaxID=3074080 RepID=UPI002858C243|nr:MULTISPECIES: CocE/NonD family hydrolase [unclassified Agromyces]MDR5700873.1 CocE/NonD family hydrolase [Agromyces sp. LY-1074]MDR5707466.1 CocE/NonD family hydrolase [Agromyces sp. LY-1358]